MGQHQSQPGPANSAAGVLPIRCTLRDDPSHAPSGFGHIALVTGNQVKVDVTHRLPAGNADVDTDVEAVRGVTLGDKPLDLAHNVHDRVHFVLGERKKIGFVTA